VNQNLSVFHRFCFAERFEETKSIKSIFFPKTVSQYLGSNTDNSSPWIEKLYSLDRIKPKTKINTLPGNYRKWLEIFASFSKSDFVVFDTLGQDPLGVEQTFKYVREFVAQGGAAILLDNFDEPNSIFDRYYKLKFK